MQYDSYKCKTTCVDNKHASFTVYNYANENKCLIDFENKLPPLLFLQQFVGSIFQTAFSCFC